jgi:hypothetical protein
MVLYLLSSVVGVVVIVLLVVHLTKAGTSSPPAGSSTSPSTGTNSGGAAAPTTKYKFIAASKAGKYKLDPAATRAYGQQAVSATAAGAEQITTRGAGKPGRAVPAFYDLGPATLASASGSKVAVVVGYVGTFKPASVIKYEKTQLIDTRMVPAGPNGGEMMCGYNRSTGHDASECVWATASTWGQIEFIEGTAGTPTPIKYPGASAIALTIRDAVEVPAS